MPYLCKQNSQELGGPSSTLGHGMAEQERLKIICPRFIPAALKTNSETAAGNVENPFSTLLFRLKNEPVFGLS
jgi:hypothetical protein